MFDVYSYNCFYTSIYFSLVKLLIPIKSIRYFCTSAVQYSVSLWVSFVILIAKFFSPTKIEVEQNKELDKNGSYLIICNHKSWLDTFVLMMIFHKKIAFPKFFMKFQVFFIPVLGLIAWALEFPAMKRYKKEYLKKHPEKKVKILRKQLSIVKNYHLDQQLSLILLRVLDILLTKLLKALTKTCLILKQVE